MSKSKNVEAYSVGVIYCCPVNLDERFIMCYVTSSSLNKLEKKIKKLVGKSFLRIESIDRIDAIIGG